MLKLRIDDPLDAVAVHMGGGTLGVLMVPFFMTEYEDGIVIFKGIFSQAGGTRYIKTVFRIKVCFLNYGTI